MNKSVYFFKKYVFVYLRNSVFMLFLQVSSVCIKYRFLFNYMKLYASFMFYFCGKIHI